MSDNYVIWDNMHSCILQQYIDKEDAIELCIPMNQAADFFLNKPRYSVKFGEEVIFQSCK